MMYWFIFILGLLADQLSKAWIMRTLPLGETRAILPPIFSLTHVLNKGAAWSVLAKPSWGIHLLTLISAVAFVGMMLYFVRWARAGEKLPLMLMASGCLGNLLDRLRFRAVVDFLDVHYRQFQYPIFNVADMLLVCGTLLLLYQLLWKTGEGRPYAPDNVPNSPIV